MGGRQVWGIDFYVSLRKINTMSENSILSLLPVENEALLEESADRIALIEHKLKFVELKPKVACLASLSPVSTAEKWVPQLITLAGGVPISTNDLITADPDLLILAVDDSSIEDTVRQIDMFFALAGMASLDAVMNGNMYIVDATKYLNATPSGIIDSLEMLAEMINPQQFAFGFEGRGWIRFGA